MRSHLVSILLGALTLVACGESNEPSIEAQRRTQHELTQAEQRKFEQLTVRQIMQGPGVIGQSPRNQRFSADGFTVYFEWTDPARLDSLNAEHPQNAYENYQEMEDDAGTYALDIASGRVAKLSAAEVDTLATDGFAWDTARIRRAELRGGDVYLVDTKAGTTRCVARTADHERDLAISPDGTRVFFRRGSNLFLVAWSGGPIEQLTDLKFEDEPDEKEASEQRQFLIDQQEEIFDEFDDEEEKEDEYGLKKVYVGSGWGLDGMLVAPSGRYVCIGVTKEASGTRRPIVPQWVTESGYVETRDTRAKVGEKQDETRVGVIDLSEAKLHWMDGEENWWVSPMSWSPTEDQLLVRAITTDWHDRFFLMVTMDEMDDDGNLRPRQIDNYHDKEWVGGPSFYSTGDWLPDGGGIYFVSENEGFSHLYVVGSKGSKTRLTKGKWEVTAAYPTDDGKWLVITNEGAPGSKRLWEMAADGGERRLLTPEPGNYQVEFNADKSKAAVVLSRVNAPGELYVYDVARGELQGPHTTSTTNMFREYPWIVPDVITFKASDGERVRAHIFRPEDLGQKPNGAGVIFIHGAGYLQNVMDWWAYYYREYMFHHLLAARGYTVLNVDFRGSAGYGQECRTAIYHDMGGRDLGDIIDAAKYLKKKHGVGKNQVGVYGGSYGGFLTLMAMFKNSDDIACGAALRSVTDWAHYNHWYTSRILGTPVEDPEAYQRSSPINFAEGLKGRLLMLHGAADSNVLAADIMRLSQRLIELEKENWELALNPMESHGYVRATSWTDQMRRVLKLFEETLPNDAQK